MAKQIEIQPEWDNIAKLAAMARNSGTSYGRLVAAMYAAKQCDYIQQDRIFKEYKRRQAAHKQQEKQENETISEVIELKTENAAKFCPFCGSRVRGRAIYCNNYCRYMYRMKLKQEAKENEQGSSDRKSDG